MGHGRMASERLSREIVPPATRTARHGPYLLVRVRVRPEHDRVQSCAIALRSPASERSSDLKRYSPDIHGEIQAVRFFFGSARAVKWTP